MISKGAKDEKRLLSHRRPQEGCDMTDSDSAMGTVTVTYDDAIVTVEKLRSGRNRIAVKPLTRGLFIPHNTWETSYPLYLIEQILNLKGPAYLCDEIMRDEDEMYVRHNFKYDILSYVSEEEFRNKRILDFGCGSGASTMVLARMFPEAEIVGVDRDEKLISIAGLRAVHYALKRISFFLSPDNIDLPAGIGGFDYVIFSAVFEHLLHEERNCLLRKIWHLLKPEGIIFIDQTPNRYFPIELHTTGLPLINYFPDMMTYYLAKIFSKRISAHSSWEALLRAGIRGGTVPEIMKILGKDVYAPLLLTPSRLNVRDRIDLWYTSSIIIRFAFIKTVAVCLLKVLHYVTGITLVPYLSLAVRKVKEDKR